MIVENRRQRRSYYILTTDPSNWGSAPRLIPHRSQVFDSGIPGSIRVDPHGARSVRLAEVAFQEELRRRAFRAASAELEELDAKNQY